MAKTLTRTNSKPDYKDYVNFLDTYKDGRTSQERSLSPEKRETGTDQTDFTKCVSYNNFLNTYKDKKFSTVKPNFLDGTRKSEQKTMKSELFIEIKPEEETKPYQRIDKKIQLFQTTGVDKQKSNWNQNGGGIANIPPPPSPPILSPKPMMVVKKQNNFAKSLPSSSTTIHHKTVGLNSRPTTTRAAISLSQAPPKPPPLPTNKFAATIVNPLNSNRAAVIHNGNNNERVQAPSNSNKFLANNTPIDRNDPRIKKLVYGTLRGMYGAYHDKANDYVATLPRNMVQKQNGIQNIINDMAARGDLDKLNGRANPKQDQELN